MRNLVLLVVALLAAAYVDQKVVVQALGAPSVVVLLALVVLTAACFSALRGVTRRNA